MKVRGLSKVSVRHRRILTMSVLIILLIGIGIAGFMYFEDLHLFEALWLMVISILTIGYGDIYPLTKEGRIFTLFIVPAGIVVFSYGFGTAASYFLEKHFPEKVREKRMEKELKKLNDHIIICGSGIFAQQVFNEIITIQPHATIVFISEDQQFMEDHLKSDILRIVGDPTEKSVLERARVTQAQALFAAMQDDADNVFITLTAKNLNDSIKVAARANKEGSEAILEKAGAVYIVNPYVIGGQELAMSILQPHDASQIVDLRNLESGEFSVGEVMIDEASAFIHRSLRQLDLQEQFGVLVAGVNRNGRLISDTAFEEELQDQDVLLLVGKPAQIEAARNSA